MAEVTDVVERVARAIYRQLGGGSGDYDDAARAALAAMLEAVGEPVAWVYERQNRADGSKPYSQRRWVQDVMMVQPVENDWQQNATPLYSLAALREEV